MSSQVGQEVIAGRYHLVARIGSGGMGEVYRARDPVLSRTVALKLLPPRFASDPGFVDRFRSEAQSAARLSHPNVVQVHDWGETGDTYFMVMEHVRGKNLREILSQRGALPVGQALDIVQQVLLALAAAHAQGLVHRDIKPENILISVDGVAKVADFGIAKVMDDQVTGGMLGTVAYAAPEQARGPAVDHRSDIYSVGCVMYEMLTGDRPFQGDAARLLHQHLTERVPSPSSTDPDIRPEVDAIVLRATAPDPDDRYQDAVQMRTDVVSAAGAGQAAAPLAELTYDLTSEVPIEAMHTAVASTPKKRRWKRWVVLALLLSLLAAGVVVYQPSKLPDASGMQIAAARRTLTEAGFKVKTREVFSNDDPQGFVVSSDPRAGRWLLSGSTVELVISKGPRLTDVPEVTGMDVEAAKRAITEAGLTIGDVIEKSDRSVKGRVLSQTPLPGRARRGDPVNMTVSAGPKVLEVPDVRNKPAADAKKILSDMGFDVTEEEVFASNPPGSVADQTPPPGTKASQGSTVQLKVSKGPAPFAMPDVRNKPCTDAKTQLNDAGLKVDVRNSGGAASCGSGKVLEQDPLPGATVRPGDEVTLYVA